MYGAKWVKSIMTATTKLKKEKLTQPNPQSRARREQMINKNYRNDHNSVHKNSIEKLKA